MQRTLYVYVYGNRMTVGPTSKSLYRVSHKKQNGGFLVHCKLKVLHMFISLDRASAAEENGTNIVKFGLSNFDSMTIP